MTMLIVMTLIWLMMVYFLHASHYVKEVAIKQGAIFEALFEALHELVLLPHPASKT